MSDKVQLDLSHLDRRLRPVVSLALFVLLGAVCLEASSQALIVGGIAATTDVVLAFASARTKHTDYRRWRLFAALLLVPLIALMDAPLSWTVLLPPILVVPLLVPERSATALVISTAVIGGCAAAIGGGEGALGLISLAAIGLLVGTLYPALFAHMASAEQARKELESVSALLQERRTKVSKLLAKTREHAREYERFVLLSAGRESRIAELEQELAAIHAQASEGWPCTSAPTTDRPRPRP